METDKRYFLEGLFIVAIAAAAIAAFIWLGKTGQRDDVLYRIRFNESVSGLSVGEPVRLNGVNVGNVKSLSLDPEDARNVLVDVSLRRDAPIKTDTRATLRMKGFTGVMFVELSGGAPEEQKLVEATASGQTPLIPADKSTITNLTEALPKVLEGFADLQVKTSRVLGDVGVITHNMTKASKDVGAITKTMKDASVDVKQTTEAVKEDPSLLIWKRKKKE
jgi:phospholipid/cholesterol/gamma-HCH transport system substrate-binding protein